MEPKTTTSASWSHLDPADWHYAVRRTDGGWLTRPAVEPGTPPGNMETWTRRLMDVWHFDSAADARAAAISHGADPDAFAVVPSPRRGGEWLKAEGAYAAKAA